MPTEQDQRLLVEELLNGSSNWKQTSQRLRQYPPEEEAAKSVMAAFERGTIPAWEAAYLLGCVRHPIGYAKAKEILLGQHSLSYEMYAAEALARIAPEAAYIDLLQLLYTHENSKTRRNISYGLYATGLPQRWDDLLELTLKERLRPRSHAANLLSKCLQTTQQLSALLDSDDTARQELGLMIADEQISSHSLAPELLPRIHQLLNSPFLSINSRRRDRLENRLAREH